MLINLFDNFISKDEKYPERKIWKVLISSIISYGALFVIIKNLIYYEKITENVYWILLIIFCVDILISINNNKEYIEQKIKFFSNSLIQYKKTINTPKKNQEIKNDTIKKKLLEDEDEEYTTIIV
jgi:hypothetical protein